MKLVTSLHCATDYCARYSEWLQVSLPSGKIDQDELVEKLARLKREAAANNIKKIELNLSPAEVNEYSAVLHKAGFQSGLVCLQTKLGKLEPLIQKERNGKSQSSPMVVAIKINSIPSRQLLSLLQQQVKYHYQVRPSYYLAPNEIDWPAYLAALEKDRQREYCFQLVALVEDKPVGLIFAETNPEEKQLNVSDVIVDEAYRAQGVGKRLFASLNQLGFNQKMLIELETYEQMPAMQWYLKMGFEEKGRSCFWVEK